MITSDTSVGAPCSLRMSRRSIAAPIRGASTRMTSTSDGSTGHPCLTVSSQYVNAAIIPTAPWAKLKMPEVM